MRRGLMRALPICVALAMAIPSLPAAAFNEAVDTGTTAFYTVFDDSSTPGVTCKYEDNSGTDNDELDRIRVRNLQAHGPFATKSWVGYRFLVKRQRPPFTESYRTVYRSPVIKKKANQSEVAFFPWRTWTAPEGTHARYRVHILLYWYKRGSTTQVIGKMRGLIEVYKHKLGSGSPYLMGSVGSAGYCEPEHSP